MYIKCACQHCKGHIEYDDVHVGVSVKCPHCFEPTLLSAQMELAPSQAAEIDLEIKEQNAPPERKATEKQLAYIRVLGGTPFPDLSISEASKLIGVLLEVSQEQKMKREEDRRQNPAHYLRLDCEDAKKDLENAERGEISDAKMYLRDAQNERIEFWKDTFRVDEVEVSYYCKQTIRLYCDHAHRFKMPAEKRIQAILNALDANSPTWDIDGTVSFYLTLEASFPELIRKKIDYESLEFAKESLNSDYFA